MNPTLARWRALLGRERANSAGLPNAEGGPDTAQLDQAGELLRPLKLVSCSRWPVARSWR